MLTETEKEDWYYMGLDLRTATQNHLWRKFNEYPPVLTSPPQELSDEEDRVFSLIAYAENYNLTTLTAKLKVIYKEFW